MWATVRAMAIPESAAFTDYSAMSYNAVTGLMAITSQADSQVGDLYIYSIFTLFLIFIFIFLLQRSVVQRRHGPHGHHHAGRFAGGRFFFYLFVFLMILFGFLVIFTPKALCCTTPSRASWPSPHRPIRLFIYYYYYLLYFIFILSIYLLQRYVVQRRHGPPGHHHAGRLAGGRLSDRVVE
jgi:hypothetical protein